MKVKSEAEKMDRILALTIKDLQERKAFYEWHARRLSARWTVDGSPTKY